MSNYEQKQDTQEYGLISQLNKFFSECFISEFPKDIHFSQNKNSKQESLQEIYQGEISLHNQKCRPQHITQGQSGDCHIVSSLVALSLYLQLCLRQNEYIVRLFMQGRPVQVTVNDRVPCKQLQTGQKSPLFCNYKPFEGHTKAFAKVYNSYLSLSEGFCSETLRMLTGFPVKVVFNNQKYLFEYLEQIKNDKGSQSLIVASSKDVQSKENIKKSHAYTVLNVFRLGYKKIVALYNCWGTDEGKGQVSESKLIWKPVNPFKKLVYHYWNKDDGIFYLSQEQFIQNFNSVAIARLRKDTVFKSFEFVDQKNQGVLYRFQIKNFETGHYIFTIDQAIIKAGQKKRNMNTLTLALFKNNNGPRFISKTQDKRAFVQLQAQLEQGVYYIFGRNCNSNQNNEKIKNLIGVYSHTKMKGQVRMFRVSNNNRKQLMACEEFSDCVKF